MISEKLKQIEGYLNNIKAPVLKHLLPEVEAIDLETIAKQFLNEDHIPDGIAVLYKWHGGTDVSNQVPPENFYLFPNYFLKTIDHIRLQYEENKLQIIENEMFPIFSSGLGEYLTIDLKCGENSKIYCLQSWNPDADTYTTIYDSFEIMLDTIIACYKDNAYFTSGEGLLDMDFEKS
jgi:hypothetical protein